MVLQEQMENIKHACHAWKGLESKTDTFMFLNNEFIPD